MCMADKFPTSLPDFQRMFPDDRACAQYLEAIRWREGFVCPKCNSSAVPYRFENRPGVLRCKGCKRDVALTGGTVMERTHTPLSTWFWSAFLVASLTPGIAARPCDRSGGSCLCGVVRWRLDSSRHYRWERWVKTGQAWKNVIHQRKLDLAAGVTPGSKRGLDRPCETGHQELRPGEFSSGSYRESRSNTGL